VSVSFGFTYTARTWESRPGSMADGARRISLSTSMRGLLLSPPLCLGEPLVQVDPCNGTDMKLAPPPSLHSLLFCWDSDENKAMALVRGRQWHPYRRDILIGPSIFPQAYVPPSPLSNSILYTGRRSFGLRYLSPSYRSQIWISGVDLFPPVFKKTPRMKPLPNASK
jgi:hypothetical protein